MEEEKVDRIKRNFCFGGQDFLCEPLGIILEELVRLWVQMENTISGCTGKLKAASSLFIEGEAVWWVVVGLKSVWDDGFWIVGLPLNRSWGHLCCLFPRCPDFRSWATPLARVLKRKQNAVPIPSLNPTLVIPGKAMAFLIRRENPGLHLASLSSGWARAVSRPWSGTLCRHDLHLQQMPKPQWAFPAPACFRLPLLHSEKELALSC